jgi:hypothetical protein
MRSRPNHDPMNTRTPDSHYPWTRKWGAGQNAPENFGLLRRLALCLLKKEPSSKRSIKGKRLRASWDEGYLQRVLCGNAGN